MNRGVLLVSYKPSHFTARHLTTLDVLCMCCYNSTIDLISFMYSTYELRYRKLNCDIYLIRIKNIAGKTYNFYAVLISFILDSRTFYSSLW